MLGEIKERVEALGIGIEFDEDCVDLLSAEGYDQVYGARPLRRAIQRKIEDSFSLEMLEGRVKKGDRVTVSVEEGNIIYKPA